MMSGYDFVKYQFEIYPSKSAKVYGTLASYEGNKGIDWQDQVLRTGATQIHNIALRGGNKQTKYSLSGSIYDQDAIILNTGYKR